MTNIEDIKKLRGELTIEECQYTGILEALDATEALLTDEVVKEAQEAVYWDSVSMFGDLQEY